MWRGRQHGDHGPAIVGCYAAVNKGLIAPDFWGIRMFWRPITKADLPVIFSDHPAGFGSELIGEAAAWEAWHHLLSWPGFNGVVIEKRGSGQPAERLGFGASVFVSEAFVQQEITYPRPGLNGRMLAEFACRTVGVLGLRQIAEDNASEGLNVLTLFGRPLSSASQREAVEVRPELAAAFVEIHAGYRFRRILIEIKDRVDVELAPS
jgi:hypothetical protein